MLKKLFVLFTFIAIITNSATLLSNDSNDKHDNPIQNPIETFNSIYHSNQY